MLDYMSIIWYIEEDEDRTWVISFLSFLDSSMAEHTAVNRGVVGSSPTRGAKKHERVLKK